MKVSLVLVLIACVACISVAEDHHSYTEEEENSHDNQGGKVAEQKHEVSSGKSSKHDEESSKKGQDLKEVHKTNYVDKKGKKTSHNLEDSHKSSKHAAGGSHHGLKHADGKKYKKGNYLKGFREKFHKDEEKKHDSFFSKGEKSGQYEVYGKKKSKYASDSYSKKNKKNHKNSVSGKSAGKAYKSAKGHHDSDHKAHQAQGGGESHLRSSEKHGKKHASHGGKKYKNLEFIYNKIYKDDHELQLRQQGINFYGSKINISKQNDTSVNKIQISEKGIDTKHSNNEAGYQTYNEQTRREKRETKVLNNTINNIVSNSKSKPNDGIIRITIIKEDGIIYDTNITISKKIHKSYKKHNYQHQKKQVGQTQSEFQVKNETESNKVPFKIIRLKPLRSWHGRKNRSNSEKRGKSKNERRMKSDENHHIDQNIRNNKSELQNITNNSTLPKGKENESRNNTTAATDHIFYRLLVNHQNENHNRINSNNTALIHQNNENNKERIVENYNTLIVQRENHKAQEEQVEKECPEACNCNKDVTKEINQYSEQQNNSMTTLNTQINSKVQLRQDENSLTETKTPRPRKKPTKRPPISMDYWLLPMVFF